MENHWLIRALGPGIAMCAAPFAYAEVYLTEDEAKAVLFPGESFTDASVALSDAQRKDIAKSSGVRVRDANLRAFRASGGGWLLFDHVVGKHEHINIALALNADGSVRSVEVMEYRETYGGEVRDEKWRAQFEGKTVGSPLKLDEDIVNISGATLSSNNITKGVRRLLHSWNLVLKP